MNIALLYGRTGLNIQLPDAVQVIQGSYIHGVADEKQALLSALRYPIGKPALRTLVKPGQRVVIVHSDITRAIPNKRILPILLEELESAGIELQDITLLNGLGTHRKQTEAETRTLLGDSVVDHYRCLQHDCYDDSQLVSLGVTSHGHPLVINRTYLDADIRVLTGFIEPHLFAGFSGGPKAVLPSIAGIQTILANHGYQMIAHPNATWGITEGNPIWEEMRAAALMTEPTFLLNVTLNRDQQITGIFAGDLLAAHKAGCEFVRQTAMVEIDELFDIVLATNGGYPLDQNLYQTGKGVKAAAQAVRPDGAILMFSACEDGLPDHGMYHELLKQAKTPERMLEMIADPDFLAQDQWQVQSQSLILLNHPVYIFSDGLSDEQIRSAHYRPCRDVAALLDNLSRHFGPKCRIAVLPEGPYTIPRIR